MVHDDLPDDIVGRLCGVVVPNHLCALFERRFENRAGEFLLTSFVDGLKVFYPYVGDENDVFQGRFAAKFTEQVEIPSGDPAEPTVGDLVDVDDPGERGLFPISIQESSP